MQASTFINEKVNDTFQIPQIRRNAATIPESNILSSALSLGRAMPSLPHVPKTVGCILVIVQYALVLLFGLNSVEHLTSFGSASAVTPFVHPLQASHQQKGSRLQYDCSYKIQTVTPPFHSLASICRGAEREDRKPNVTYTSAMIPASATQSATQVYLTHMPRLISMAYLRTHGSCFSVILSLDLVIDSPVVSRERIRANSQLCVAMFIRTSVSLIGMPQIILQSEERLQHLPPIRKRHGKNILKRIGF
ncbi:uncharacterized protein RSE6_12921 [Rhynchosporium secalis]|uniref:Uncharacterized protein n=1 Tax=Rhynchosporium secalis TaxID=38038 RepID=A0A1E1MRL5_RHYSE|nr:uncharacterized protein RSE6_12921 [Rhynchosporium secalis]